MKVAIACGLDLIHEGHLEHLDEAAKLGDELIIMVAPDSTYINKGFCLIPLESRLSMARIIASWIGPAKHIKVSVIAVIDTDGTCSETLKSVLPDIFAKGGDRVAGNMPDSEVSVCKDINCEIRYGVGRLLNSRTRLFTNAAR